MEIKKEPEVIPEDTPKTEPAGQTDKVEQTGQTEPAPAGKPEAAPKEKNHKKNKGEAKAEALQAEIDQLKAELDGQKDAYQRMLAEYANYKRRTEQEKERIGEFTKADLLKHLLTSVDNMERALEAADGPEYKKGVDMTFRQFHETLAALGLEDVSLRELPSRCPPEHREAARRMSERLINQYRILSSAQEPSRILMESRLRLIEEELQRRGLEEEGPSTASRTGSDTHTDLRV